MFQQLFQPPNSTHPDSSFVTHCSFVTLLMTLLIRLSFYLQPTVFDCPPDTLVGIFKNLKELPANGSKEKDLVRTSPQIMSSVYII